MARLPHRYRGGQATRSHLRKSIFAMLKKQQNSKNIIIEKHVKLSNSKAPDASSSITTEELSQLVSSIRQIEKLKI